MFFLISKRDFPFNLLSTSPFPEFWGGGYYLEWNNFFKIDNEKVQL